MNNKDYKRMFLIVKKVINDLDLLGLIKKGINDDEYEEEIAKIVARINHFTDINKLQEDIYSIFKDSFGADSAGEFDLYNEAAERIVKGLDLK